MRNRRLIILAAASLGLVALGCESGDGAGTDDASGAVDASATDDSGGTTGPGDDAGGTTSDAGGTRPGDDTTTAVPDAAAPDGTAMADSGTPTEDTNGAGAGGDDGGGDGPSLCPAELDCDDGLACTADACDPATGQCTWQTMNNTCLIGGVCRAAGDPHPLDPCRICDPTLDSWGWTAFSDGDACDDGDACTEGDTCQLGTCAGVAKDCGDGNACTEDSCDSGACSSTAVAESAACDDGDACTDSDECMAGDCSGVAIDCDDGEVCTDDSCDGVDGCMWIDNTAACEDGDLCTSGDTCAEGSCSAGAPTNCDDGDICSIDVCDALAGCAHVPTLNACCTGGGLDSCDDNNPCTTAACDEVSGECIHEPNAAACDDDDACTEADVCADGECGGATITCDDDNPCTDDACNTAQGCFFVDLDGVPCDDGLECSTGDTCTLGSCEGDTSGCTCTPTFDPDAGKVTVLSIGASGHPGDGLDLDGDPATCAPEGDCSGGVHNALSILAGLANDSLVGSVADGSLNLVFEFKGLQQGSFTVAAYTGELDPANAGCDIQVGPCGWIVSGSVIDPDTCEPLVKLPATLDGTHLVAGGQDTVFPFSLPLGDTLLTVTLVGIQLDGTVTLTDGQVTAFEGVLGGAIPKVSLLAAIDAAPDDALPLPKDTVKGFIDIIANDIDSSGDGTLDAVSLGLKLEGVDATIVGVEP